VSSVLQCPRSVPFQPPLELSDRNQALPATTHNPKLRPNMLLQKVHAYAERPRRLRLGQRQPRHSRDGLKSKLASDGVHSVAGSSRA
jgi:hypothetical protein